MKRPRALPVFAAGLLACSAPIEALAKRPPKLDEALSLLAKQLVPRRARRGTVVAFLPLTGTDGKGSEFGAFAAVELATELHRLKKLNLIDATLMKKILDEMKLVENEPLDQKTAKELGLMLGADWIGTGVYTDLGGSLRVNARLFKTESGVAETAAKVDVRKNAELSRLLYGGDPDAEAAAVSRAVPPGSRFRKGGLLARPDCDRPDGVSLAVWDGRTMAYCRRGKFHYDNPLFGPELGANHGIGPKVRNFVLEAKVKKLKGPDDRWFGLLFRNQGGWTTYLALINGKGMYKLSTTSAGGVQESPIREGNAFKDINHGGNTNKIRIETAGTRINFLVNGRLVATADDETLDEGDISFTAAGQVHAEFSDLSLYAIKAE